MQLRRGLLGLALALALTSPAIEANPFTFQGFLEQSGSPLDGNANLAFKLFNASSGGTQIGSTITANAYPVLNGVFTIDLNFAGVMFQDEHRWLQVEINGIPMGTRIEILPTPLAGSALALQGRRVSMSVPVNGQVLKWDGNQWAPQNDATGASYSAGNGLNLAGTEFSVNFGGSGAANSVARSDHSHYGQTFSGSSALQGLNISQNNGAAGATGLFSIAQANSGVTIGVAGVSNSSTGSARGVFGHATAGSGDVWGVHGRTDSTAGRGVFGHAAATSGNTSGVLGQTDSSTLGARGVYGLATATSGDVYGVHGRTESPQGRGVFGLAAANTGFAPGVVGETLSASDGARGVYGLASANSGSTSGVSGVAFSTGGTGVRGEVTATTGNTTGVHGTSASSQGIGVRGTATSATGNTVGVRGDGRIGMVANGAETGLDAVATNTVGQAVGVQAATGAADGAGVFAINSATTGNAYGAYAQTNSSNGTALAGEALATSGANRGVLARTVSGGGVGLRAENTSSAGLATALEAVGGSSGGTTAVFQANGGGSSWAIDAASAGPTGRAINARLTTTGAGVSGAAVYAQVNGSNARALQGVNLAGGLAGDFTGNVAVSGTLSKGGGSFKIDHPLDPENKYLLHSFVESPDMMNIYNGNIVTDRNGYATVELPDWFEVLNRDFRYQLTVIGEFAQAIVSKKLEGNRFEIRSSQPGVEVSWQITGVRQDAWAQKYRIPVEQDKATADRGKFLHPEAHGQPADKAIGLAFHGNKSGNKEQPQ